MNTATRLHDRLGLRTSPRIFFGAAAVVLTFVVATIAFTDQVDAAFAAASAWLLDNLGWFYILGVTSFLVFLLFMAASRYGRVKLGPETEAPEHLSLIHI